MFEPQQLFANFRRVMASLLTTAIALGPSVPAFASSAKPTPRAVVHSVTATPIQYLVVIFQENVSFDHYFGTYPNAKNPPFENKFTATATTPVIDGLTNALLTHNPNLNPSNNAGASNPFRIDNGQEATSDQDHNYLAEQQAFDAGLMDLFPLSTGVGGTAGNQVMGYFDGNTTTALWNYAQHFAMSDNSYGTTFGPSTPGVLNLISGQTNGATATLGTFEVNGGPDGSLSVVSKDQGCSRMFFTLYAVCAEARCSPSSPSSRSGPPHHQPAHHGRSDRRVALRAARRGRPLGVLRRSGHPAGQYRTLWRDGLH